MPRIAVTIPASAAAALRAELQKWGAVASARIVGRDDTEVGMYLATRSSPIALSFGSAGNGIEERIRKFGGRVGVRDEWISADRDLGDFLTHDDGNDETDAESPLSSDVSRVADKEKTFLIASARVAEFDTDRRMEARAVTSRFDFGTDLDLWLIEAIQNLSSLGLLVPYQRDGSGDDQFVQITPAGVRKAKQWEPMFPVYSRGEESLPSVPHSDGTRFSDGTGYAGSVGTTAQTTEPVDSSTWTGVERPEVIEGERLEKLKAELAKIEQKVERLDFSTNSDRQQVMAYITAIKVLADAPEPPASIIRDLIQLLDSFSSIGQFLLAIAILLKA